jgi:anti-sigma factor RsiW
MTDSSDRDLDCQRWVELVTDYLDGVLDSPTVAAVHRHLAECDGCEEYLAQMRRTIELTGRLSDDPVPDTVLDALQRAFQEQRADL